MVRLCYIHVHLDLLIIDQVEPSRYIIQCGPSPVKAACIQAISLQIIQSHARHPPSSSFPAPDKHKTKNHADTTPAQAIALLNHSLLQHRHPPNAVNRNPNYLRVFFLGDYFLFLCFLLSSAFLLLCFCASLLFCFSAFLLLLLFCFSACLPRFSFFRFSLAAVPCFNTFFCYFCFLCFCFPLLLLSSAFVFLCFSASLIVCFAFVFFNFLLAVLSCFSICFLFLCFCFPLLFCFSAFPLLLLLSFLLFCFSDCLLRFALF